MKDGFLFCKKTNVFNVFFPFFIAIVISVLYSLINNFDPFPFFGLPTLSLIYIYFDSSNAVSIYASEEKFTLKNFFDNKYISISYDKIIDIKYVSSGVYGGIFVKFIVKNNEKDLIFKIRLYDKEFIQFLEKKTKIKVA
jgi:hypothetical protein